MGKPSVNQKAVDARERKAAAAAAKRDEAAKKAEDARWADDNSQIDKRNKKKQEALEKAEARQQRRQENRRIEEEEGAVLQKSIQKVGAADKKISRAEIERRLELSANKESEEPTRVDYLVPNPNRELRDTMDKSAAEGVQVLDASGIDNILDAVEGSTVAAVKQRAAIFNAYKAKMLPQLREQNPGLKHSQLVQMCFKEVSKEIKRQELEQQRLENSEWKNSASPLSE